MRKAICLLLILSASIILWKCASQTTPTGGPKDETPPKLKKIIPFNNQLNFKGKTVELTFDEFLKLNNAKEEIIITPSPGKDILFIAKQYKVIIEPKEGWKDSTTYSISFRDGIQDLNEGNAVKDLHLAFSTGATIDSLQISGKVKESLSEKIPENITVAVYREDTFNIFEHIPSYFTKTKEDGSFKIENLQDGDYTLYAFEDKNKNLKIESTTEKFGFLSKTILPKPPLNKIDSLIIALYKIDSRPIKISNIRNTGTITKIKLNKNLVTYGIDNPNHVKIHHQYSDHQSEVSIYHELNMNDSVPIRIRGVDSIGFKIDSLFYIKRIESKLEKEKFTLKIISSTISPETFAVDVTAQFSKPLQLINFDSIYLTPDRPSIRAPKEKPGEKKQDTKKEQIRKERALKKDTTSVKKDTTINKPITKIPIPRQNISVDSTKRILTLSTSIDKKIIAGAKEKIKEISLVLEDAALISIEQDSSKREIRTIPIIDEENTGTLQIDVTTQYKNYEVHLLSAEGKILQKVRNVKKHLFKYLQPQEYKLMIYADLNNNGIWDSQNILTKTMPEPTYFYKTPEGKYTFPIRAAWELGPLPLKF